MNRSQRFTPDRSNGSDTYKLFRAMSDVVKHLENQRARTEHISDLFTEPFELLRMKVRDYGDRLMFSDPTLYGKKVEDVIWRKVFYETVTAAKKMNKNVKTDSKEMYMIRTHLQSGIGFYHHIIMKLQSQFNLDLRDVVDFPLLVSHCRLVKGKTGPFIIAEGAALDWAHSALHKCLIYLGDICRYLSDLDPTYDPNNAFRYYVQALNWKPDLGLPHNQLGTLASNNNYLLDAVYHYMRCLCAKEKFDGADGNLLNLMELNHQRYLDLSKRDNHSNIKKLVVTFIQLACYLFYDKLINQTDQLCSEVFSSLECCLAESEIGCTHATETYSEEPSILNDDILFKIFLISTMCVQKLNFNTLKKLYKYNKTLAAGERRTHYLQLNLKIPK